MGSRELVQVPSATKNPPLTTEGVAPAKTPVLGGVQNTVIDQSLRPSHEPVPLRTQLPPRGRLGTGERDRQFFSSDDSALDKRILATHAPDMQELNVKPILSIIEGILRLVRPLTEDRTAAAAVPGAQVSAHLDTSAEKVSSGSYHDDEAQQTSNLESDIVKLQAYPINNISCEIVRKCIGREESHAVTMDLLKSLASYSWDAKLVIAFAGFAIIKYGEFWLVEHFHTKNVIATLRDLPDIIGGELRKQFGAVLDLLTTILKVTHCIIEFNELLPSYINGQSPAITAATAHIPAAVYWSIRGLLVCASTLLKLVGDDHEYITLTWVSWEILNLAHKLNVILEELQAHMKLCGEINEWKKSEGAYIKLKRLVESAHVDSMTVLRAFFHYRDDQRPLYDGAERKNKRLEVLSLKYVLLLISDLDLPSKELQLFDLINSDPSVRSKCEVLWVPIVDPAITMTSIEDTKFYNLRNKMPWYSVEHPSFVDPVAIRYIWKDLRFTQMPMLVVLDPQGKLSNHDALPMMWIWGAKAFPFTRDRESRLWDESSWNIDLIADAIDPRFPEWINTNRVISLYGGDDINWIRKFTQSARAATRALNVQLEMLYVGRRNPKERVHQCHTAIVKENLSHIFPIDDYDYVSNFWERLASMLNSKKQVGRMVDDDRITRGILNLLTFGNSEQGWAIFSCGNHDITMANGENVVPILDNHREWGYDVDHPDKFVPVLDKQLQEKKKLEDAYIAVKRLLESAYIDNMKVLRAFFRYRDDQRPLYDGAKRTNERLEVLRLKYVLLLISDLHLPPEELHVLHLINNDPSMRHEYEVLWLPIVDPAITMTSVEDSKFYNLRNNMPWYSAKHPSFIDPVAIRYIREDLRFTHMPMLVVLDPHGKLSNHDALPMMWIWGAKAFPFTRDWERRLWDESAWNIDLIADAIDPRIPEWISTNKVICLYGGDDINWVRKFTQSARAAARALNVQLEMLYVGRRNPKERVRSCHEVITRENLSHIFSTDYYDFVWYFWVRLASMWNSKKQMGRTVDDDRITQGILDLLTFDSSENGWAIFSRGNYEITMANGEKVVPVLDNHPQWGYEVDHPDKFVPVLEKHLQGFHPEHHCNHLILPGQAGYIPGMVVCSECGKTMEMYVMYRCCTD